MDIREWCKRVHANNLIHGFYDGPDADNLDRKLLLAVGELAEAQEELRSGHHPTDLYFTGPEDDSKPEGFGIELADAVIRIMDICARYGIDLQHCIETKHEYNLVRPYKHNKAF